MAIKMMLEKSLWNYCKDKRISKINNNSLFRNPEPAILAKLDHYYQHQEVINTNEIKDLVGTTNATISGTYTIVTINSLRGLWYTN